MSQTSADIESKEAKASEERTCLEVQWSNLSCDAPVLVAKAVSEGDATRRKEEEQGAQEEELMSLEAMYFDSFARIDAEGERHPLVEHVSNDAAVYCISVAPVLEEPFTVQQCPLGLGDLVRQMTYGPGRSTSCSFVPPPGSSASAANSEATIEHLQPLQLYFSFPSGYPSATHPTAVVTAPWIPASSYPRLLSKLVGLWEDGLKAECLFTWVEWLRNDLLDFLTNGRPLCLALEDVFFPTLTCTMSIARHALHSGSRNTGPGVFPVPLQCEPYVNTLKAKSSTLTIEHNVTPSMTGTPVEPPVNCSLTPGLYEFEAPSSASASLVQEGMEPLPPDIWRRHIIQSVTVALRQGYEECGVMSILRGYDGSKKEEAFHQAMHSCEVCLDDVQGTHCHKFRACGHVFCKKCIRQHVDSIVHGGDIRPLHCLDPDCEGLMEAVEVRSLGGTALADKYESFLLQSALDSMSDIVYCPMKKCAKPVVLLPSEAAKANRDGRQLNRLGYCSYCQFAFCVECNKRWHGEKTFCFDIVKLYREADEEGKKALKKKYGAHIFDELESQTWLESNAKQCRFCKAYTKKEGGCNHITCRRCGGEWCWICGEPYKMGHFRYGTCEQFGQDYFNELGMSREEYYLRFMPLNHW